MKKLITTLTNIWKIDDLRTRILNTLLFLLIYRIGCHIVLPGVNPQALASGQKEGLLGLLDMFAGGSFSRSAIFALGVMPYISASIVVQLLGIAVPYFQKMQKEGESGRTKMNQITRYLTLAITLLQAFAYVRTQIEPSAKTLADPMFTILTAIVLTAGTLFVMWLGEKITDKGIGNGISLIIMTGIIAQLPSGITAEWVSRMSKGGGGPIPLLLEFLALFFVVVFTILIVQGVRKIPVQYAKKIVGNKQVGGVRQYIPLKVNAAGVMPIIFAQAIMFVPMSLGQFFPNLQSDFLTSLSNYTSVAYNVTFAILIIAFTFFYTAIMVNPQQMSDDMKKNGGFVPGIKPGLETSNFIDRVISNITFPGAIFLAIIAILPAIASLFGINNQFAHFYGGTSLLILVGVVLDTLQQIESHLLMRHYDGLMKTGRIKGRTPAAVEGVDQSAI
ncbi:MULTISPECIES: preprotein translocase subunit SecY [Sphingobacterium]|jgi:preprotein translocase subunit SecY|uniref:preprotein translocase subunit SecY n=1 Tax=Sphingobacterium TaxID=28453 RepID=UPI0004E5FB3F|nr:MULTISPECIES: preprotein translocase subunit SecY [Sphingobacterium]UZJ64860.1 preprotein translocase subunit SecY [Sphingobacterium sp. KU25419]CDS94895.1 Protein translocase subunit SecY [Sphingobacterium sp. PM2-P1-29]SJN23848.1 Preprotein translocase secY subunit (TC 3.A.5.1.1) [Sphingobacterium faecium PCAi_F2.5]HCU45492.1 preprotein translocase subunit SecY [Sphingobacterium sp.]MQP26232.1 preprotein translocase subunit SecY [Sphingobacterium faecium]